MKKSNTLKKEWASVKSKVLHGGNKFKVTARGMTTYVKPLEDAFRVAVKRTKNTARKTRNSVRGATTIARTLAWKNLVRNLSKTLKQHVAAAKSRVKNKRA